MSRKQKTILIVVGVLAALVPVFLVPMLLRARRNEALARELHAEFGKWLALLPHVPDSENGALAIMLDLEKLTPYPEQLIMMTSDELRSEQAQQYRRDYLAANREILESFEKALEHYGKWQFAMNYSENYSAPLPHLACVKEVGECFVEKAILLQHEGKNEQALNECMKALRAASTLTADKIMVSCECQIAVYRQALTEVVRIIGLDSLPEERFRGALDVLAAEYTKRGSYADAAETEYYIFIKLLADGIREGRSAVSLVNKIAGLASEEENGFLSSGCLYDYAPDVELFREYLKTYRHVQPGEYFKFRKKLELWNEHAQHVTVDAKSRRAVLAGLVLPAIGERAFKEFVIGETFWRAAMVTTALRLFEAENGKLPGNLEELGKLVPAEMLIDPFSGKQLVYKLKGGDFSLYSVGVDGVDSKCEETRRLFHTRADEGEPDDIIFHAAGR